MTELDMIKKIEKELFIKLMKFEGNIWNIKSYTLNKN